ncbi:MAG: hypothetical protein HDR27_01320 [Lachnospiraceae bacterium]|nr:hypothetical protein [Lachnospiraceae bacterium]
MKKYKGRILLQKMISTSAIQIENDGLMERYLYANSRGTIISDEVFMIVQLEKIRRSSYQEAWECIANVVLST